jgi:hypothetical protein
MELNQAERPLKIKIAYYGPAIGGEVSATHFTLQFNAL